MKRVRRSFSQQAFKQRHEDASSIGGRSASSSSTSSAAKSSAPHLEFHGRSYLLPTLTLSRACATVDSNKADDKKQFFQTRARETPIVLDLQHVSSDGSPHAQPINKQQLRRQIDQLQGAGFRPVGITNASEDVKQIAAKLQLPYFITNRISLTDQQPLFLQQHDIIAEQQVKQESTTTTQHSTTSASNNAEEQAQEEDVKTAASVPPMVVTSSVRSGQQIFAQNRSLVVLGNVNSGAEVLADGDVYIMGALKGRALAGISGNVNARIFCQSFDAELISIAHHFTTCDDVDAQQQNGKLRVHKPTSISLQDDHLHFESTN